MATVWLGRVALIAGLVASDLVCPGLVVAQTPLQPTTVGPLSIPPRDPAATPTLPDPEHRGLQSGPGVGKVVKSQLPSWQVGDIDQSLSRLCSLGKFNQRVPYRFAGHFWGPKGATLLGAAKGTGLNLFDPQRKADKGHDYWFYRDRTSDCIVFSAVVKPPKAADGAATTSRSTLGPGG